MSSRVYKKLILIMDFSLFRYEICFSTPESSFF